MTDAIRRGKNTYYLDYTYDVNNTVNNTENGYTLKFPSAALNIKANNAYISVEKLGFYDLGGMGGDLPKSLKLVNMRTTIPTSSCVDALAINVGNVNFINKHPQMVTYSELIPFQVASDVLQYTNYSDHKVMCANPFNNTFKIRFEQFSSNGSPSAVNFSTSGVKCIAFTLKVELVEEEIF
eukprot:SAG31_NODE_3425_length_4290_cov_171.943927_2_plen_181_part_00